MFKQDKQVNLKLNPVHMLITELIKLKNSTTMRFKNKIGKALVWVKDKELLLWKLILLMQIKMCLRVWLIRRLFFIKTEQVFLKVKEIISQVVLKWEKGRRFFLLTLLLKVWQTIIIIKWVCRLSSKLLITGNQKELLVKQKTMLWTGAVKANSSTKTIKMLL